MADIKVSGMTMTVSGRLDTIVGSFSLDLQLMALVTNNTKPDIVIDMKGLEYISSDAIRVLAAARRAVTAKGGQIKLLHLTQQVKNALGLVGQLSQFTVVD
jgi:anti-anti-sigma factor